MGIETRRELVLCIHIRYDDFTGFDVGADVPHVFSWLQTLV